MTDNPTCPMCGKPMVFGAIPIGHGDILRVWMCDCVNELVADTLREARDDGPQAAISLNFIPYNNEAAAFGSIPKMVGPLDN